MKVKLFYSTLVFVCCLSVFGFMSLKSASKSPPMRTYSFQPLLTQSLPKVVSDLQINTVIEAKPSPKFDMTREMLPQADLVLCADHFLSLSHREIAASLLMMKKSGSKYLLTVNYPQCLKNKNSRNGEEREINFGLTPFHFPKPLLVLGEVEKAQLVIWKMEDLP